MDHHPRVLEQRVQSIPVGNPLEVIRAIKDGGLQGFTEQYKGTATDFETAQHRYFEQCAEQHAGQHQLGQTQNGHDTGFPSTTGTGQKKQTQHHVPENP